MSRASAARGAVVVVLTLASLAYALAGVDFGHIGAALAGVHLGWLTAGIVAATVTFGLRIVRFHVLLGHQRPTFGRQVVVCGIGYLAIQTLPLRLGELVRPFLLAEDGVPVGRALGAVVVERTLDLLLLLVVLTLIGTVGLPEPVEVRGIDVVQVGQRVLVVMVGCLACVLAAVAVGGTRVAAPLARIPVVGAVLSRGAVAFGASLRELRTVEALGAVGLSVVLWITTVGGVAVLLPALEGLPTSGVAALSVTGITIVGMVAIPTPGNFGPFEAFCRATLELWSVAPSQAAAFAILWHAVMLGVHVVTGCFLLVQQGLSFTSVVVASRSLDVREP